MKKSFKGFVLASCLIGTQAFAVLSPPVSDQISTTVPTSSSQNPINNNSPSYTNQTDRLQAGNPQLNEWVREVVPVANGYVKLLDKGGYSESWDLGSDYFKQTMSRKGWVTALELARERMGNAKVRHIKDVRVAQNPPGAPKGNYMIVMYDTSFDKAENSGETVTFIQDRNGHWKLFFYQVN